jgi:hypothetical protein
MASVARYNSTVLWITVQAGPFASMDGCKNEQLDLYSIIEWASVAPSIRLNTYTL